MAQPLAMATRGKQRPTEVELSYLAGVMDSDGCFSITKNGPGLQRTKNPRYVFCMNVVNTSEDLMRWLVEKFGGHYAHRRKQVKPHHKITYDWWYNNGKALWLLKLIEPYLVVKHRQCRLAIEFLENWETNQGGIGSRTSDDEVARRERCFQQMREFNRLGLVQPQRLSPLAPE
jgi:hypothetical protein